MTKYQIGGLLVSLVFVSFVVAGCATGALQDQPQDRDKMKMSEFNTIQQQQGLPNLGWNF
jgi:hypothetical protein